MTTRLASHLSFKSALALLPPAAITPPIEAIRYVHDKNFDRWPPHINLIYPFLASPSETDSTSQKGSKPAQLKQDIHRRIQNAVKSIRPFDISLSADPAGEFSHSRKRKTVWLGPSTQSVQHLQAALQAEFSECDAEERPFVPHLSVGQAISNKGAQNLAGQIKDSVAIFLQSSMEDEDEPIALDWHVDKIFVIERQDYDDRFEVVGEVELTNE